MWLRSGAISVLLLGGLAGCFQGPNTTQVGDCAGCRAGSSSARASGGRSTSRAAGGSSSGGSGSSGSSGTESSASGGNSSGTSTTGGSSSGTIGGPDGGGCIAQFLPIEARVYDLSSTDAVAGAVVTALDQNAVPISGSSTTSRGDGTFTLCVPANTEVTPEIQAVGYPTTYLSNFNLTQPLTAFSGDNGIPLLSTTLLTAFGSIVSVGSVATQAAIMAGVESLSRQPPCLDNAANWMFALHMPDGGVLPDGGNVPADLYYVASNGFPMQTLTSTSNYGLGLFFNVDTSLTNVVTIDASNPDAGPCPIELAPEMLTGRSYAAEGSLTIALLPTP